MCETKQKRAVADHPTGGAFLILGMNKPAGKDERPPIETSQG
jgi:hypothetical protein